MLDRPTDRQTLLQTGGNHWACDEIADCTLEACGASDFNFNNTLIIKYISKYYKPTASPKLTQIQRAVTRC